MYRNSIPSYPIQRHARIPFKFTHHPAGLRRSTQHRFPLVTAPLEGNGLRGATTLKRLHSVVWSGLFYFCEREEVSLCWIPWGKWGCNRWVQRDANWLKPASTTKTSQYYIVNPSKNIYMNEFIEFKRCVAINNFNFELNYILRFILWTMLNINIGMLKASSCDRSVIILKLNLKSKKQCI